MGTELKLARNYPYIYIYISHEGPAGSVDTIGQLFLSKQNITECNDLN